MDGTGKTFSGVIFDGRGFKEYCSYIDFEKVEYYPEVQGWWEEHYLGYRNELYITMFMSLQLKTGGPLI